MPPKKALVVGLACALAGCGSATVAGPGIALFGAPWEKPLEPPPTEMATMNWALGEVTAVSLDGATLEVRMKRGTVTPGARIGIYLAAPEAPSPHYMWDEMRELRVAEATVVRVSGDRCEAGIVERSSNAPISVGDRAIELVP